MSEIEQRIADAEQALDDAMTEWEWEEALTKLELYRAEKQAQDRLAREMRGDPLRFVC